MYLNSSVRFFFFILFHEKTKTNNEFVTHQRTFGFLDFPLKNKKLDFSYTAHVFSLLWMSVNGMREISFHIQTARGFCLKSDVLQDSKLILSLFPHSLGCSFWLRSRFILSIKFNLSTGSDTDCL